MSEESSGEKRFDPTPKRKSDAAKKGDVLRSKEVATAVATATGTFTLAIVAPWLFGGIQNIARASFQFERIDLAEFTPGTRFAEAASALLPPIFVIGLAVMIITVGSQMLLGEGRFVPQNLMPKGSRINPLSGLKRIFGTQGLIELGKSILKLALLGSIAWYWISNNLTGTHGAWA